MKDLFILLCKQFIVVFVCSRAMRSLGKKEYSEIITLVGWCICGFTLYQLVMAFFDQSFIFNWGKNMVDAWQNGLYNPWSQ